MSIYDDVCAVYDRNMLPLELLIFRRLRRRIFPTLRGDVLEIGIGTGVNLPLYGSAASVTGCDASGDVLRWAAQRRTQGRVALVQGDIQRLPFADGSFDVVTASLTFCSVAEPREGLAEARRLLRPAQPEEGKPGGRLVLLEHTRGRGIGRWLTDLLHPLWCRVSHDCHLNRETAQTVAQVGFRIQRVERHALGIVRVIEATA